MNKYKLGYRVLYQKRLTEKPRMADKEETIKWADENKIEVCNRNSNEHGSSYIPHGWWIRSKWEVQTLDKPFIGVICGIRNIDITGSANEEYYWEFGERKKVYIVARNLRGFDRVPEEFITGVAWID